MNRPIDSHPVLPAWVRVVDALTILLALAALRVAVFGGIRIGALFSMSTPWRALGGLIVICGLRHYLVRTPAIHQRIWNRLGPATRRLAHMAMHIGPSTSNRVLPVWVRVADFLTVLLAVAALRVAVFGGIGIGTLFSMSTPWRALGGLIVISGVRHYLVRTPAIHRRVWNRVGTATRQLAQLALRIGQSRSMRLALRLGRASVRAYRRATHMTVAAALQVCALSALAVAQPLFDVVSREPAFFVARNTTSGQLVALVAIVAVGFPLVLVGIEAVFTRLHAVAGNFVHGVVLTLLGTVLLLPLLKRVFGLDTAPLLVAAALLAGVAAVGCLRATVVGTFLTALSPAVIVVPAVFLANPGVRDAVVGAERVATPVGVDYAPPIVFVVFDEFPTSSLLNDRREIDRSRYPNFARLADGATWYRNASTVSSQTLWAVPALVTGKYPVEPGAVPTRRYYPNNLFTMLSQSYDMTVFGRFLQLCPADACAYDVEVRDSVRALAADLAIVYLHIIAPERLAARLPPVVGDWSGFARGRIFGTGTGERNRNDRSFEFERFLETITPEARGRLYFLHTLTPHMPFEYVPSGTRYRAPDYQAHEEGGERLFLKSDPWLPLVLQQRHLLQVGFVDRFVGGLMDRLQTQGIYDESLIIVTADHGSSFQHGKARRTRDESDPADVLMVPLIIKMPGQVTGAVSDRNVETVDVLPTIASALSWRVPYDIDGHSVLDGSETERSDKTFVRRNAVRVFIEKYPAQLESRSVERKVEHFGSSLYGLGPHASLVGRPLATVDVDPRTASIAVAVADSVFEDVDVSDESLPLYVRGMVADSVGDRVSLAIGVNGVIVATTVSYREHGRWAFASMIPEEALVSGSNELRVVVVGGVDDSLALPRAPR